MGRIAGLAVIFLCLSGNPWVGNVWAQGGLPPQVAADINAAAASERGDSGLLLSRVNASIVYYPAHVEEIIATAIEAAPSTATGSWSRQSGPSPGFGGVFWAGANAGQRTAPVKRAKASRTTYSATQPPQRPALPPQTASTRPPPHSLSPDYELGLRTVVTTGETDWNHDASAGGTLGNPTSRLIYQDADVLALEIHGRAALLREYFVRGNIGFGVETLGDGNLRDNDWLTGQVLFSSTDSVLSDTGMFYITADVGREMLTFGEGQGSLALFMGFQYWREKYEAFGLYNRLTGAQTISTSTAVIRNKVEWYSFRLGALGAYRLGDRLSWIADVAIIPYTDMHNEDSHLLRSDLGAVPNIVMDGWGWGFQGETGLSYSLTQNWTATLDFRYWSLMSDGDITFSANTSLPRRCRSTTSTPSATEPRWVLPMVSEIRVPDWRLRGRLNHPPYPSSTLVMSGRLARSAQSTGDRA